MEQGERSAGRGGGWVPPRAPCALVTFLRPFPGGASRVGRGGGGRGGGRLPHLRLREAPRARSRRWLGRRFRAPERQKDGGTEAPRGSAVPAPRSAAGPAGPGGRNSVLRLREAPPVALRVGGGGVYAARGVCSLPSFGTCRSCSCVLRRPDRLSVCPPASPAASSGLASPGPGCSRGP